MVSPTINGERGVPRGFTLIELLVVLAIIAVLMTLVTPYYLHQYDRSRETVLRYDLKTLRKCLDDYVSDHDKGPESLGELVSAGYLRAVPVDPLTGKADSWKVSTHEDNLVYDVHSGAAGKSADGSEYANW